MATGYQGSFGPENPNDPVGAFLHWALYGNPNRVGMSGRGGGGLVSLPGQAASMFNPTTKAGLVNILSMFAGGGKFDASPQMGELGMPGQFEEYSPTKASLGHELGMQVEGQPHQANYAIRAANKGVPVGRYGPWAKFVHDQLFGGEAHLKGPVPRETSPHEFTSRQAEQQKALDDMDRLHELLGKSQEHNASRPFDAAAARKEAENRLLRRHGIRGTGASHQHTPDPLIEAMNAHTRQTFYGDRSASHENVFDIHPQDVARKQAALQRLYARQIHNHRN